MYLLDTNTLIYFFKGVGAVADKLLKTPPKSVALSTIVLFELEIGILKSSSPRKRISQLQSLASTLTIFPFGHDEAKAAADIRVRLEKKSTLIGPYDILIAATAIARKCKLVTHNVAEFERIDGLAVEDWF